MAKRRSLTPVIATASRRIIPGCIIGNAKIRATHVIAGLRGIIYRRRQWHMVVVRFIEYSSCES